MAGNCPGLRGQQMLSIEVVGEEEKEEEEKEEEKDNIPSGRMWNVDAKEE